MNLDQLLNQFIGNVSAPNSGNNQSHAEGQSGLGNLQNSLSNVIPGNIASKVPGGLAGGLAAGGLLGLLVGNKKVRKTVGKVAGSAVTLGGAAALGVLAYSAYNNWQSGKRAPSAPVNPAPASPPPHLLNAPSEESFAPEAHVSADNQPFQLVLVKAMIAAANADGHIDSDEQKNIFDAVDKMGLASDEKALVFDTLRNPPDVTTIAAYANGLEQASEIYLASRLAIDPDIPVELQYLSALAEKLSLPADFVAHLESQIEETVSA